MAGLPTPQLDSRNQSFLSPAKVQALPPPRVPNLGSQPPNGNMPLTKPPPDPARTSPQLRPQNHGRSSSFFASFRGKDKNPPPADHHSTQQPTQPNATSSSRPSSEMRGPPPSQQQQQQQQTQTQTPPANDGASSNLHPEIRSIVQLTVAHAHKVYFSGPLIRRIERQPDGQKPHKDEGWVNVWAQLGGTTLSIWDMKAVEEASKRGEEVPPTYVNMTDAFVQVLGSVTVPGHSNAPPQKYMNVLTLNTAGSNLLLFSCPSSEALMSWAAALRLASWEKSRLEEIYTAHIIRITLSNRAIPSTLNRGKLEGWARVRVAGQTDWKHLWLVVTAVSSNHDQAAGNGTVKKNRMSQLFSRDGNESHGGPSKSSITMFASQKPKDRKTPILTLYDVTQAFAVYPERPELITRSSLIKIEGQFGSEETAGAMASREGWLLIMPMIDGTTNPSAEMLKWLIALHDAFGLYGRPREWTWDPRDPKSMMFAYPVGPQKDQLFLDRESAEKLDPRDDRTSAIRSGLLNILIDAMRSGQHGPVQPPSQVASSSGQPSRDAPPRLPPIGEDSPSQNGPQIPPLNFEMENNNQGGAGNLTPIREGSVSTSHYSTVDHQAPAAPSSSLHPDPLQDTIHRPIINREFTTSPISTSPSPDLDGNREATPPITNGRTSYDANRHMSTAPRQTLIPASSDFAAVAAGSTSLGPASPRSNPEQLPQHSRQESLYTMTSARRASIDSRSPPTSPPTIPLPKSPEGPSISESSGQASLTPSSPHASFMTSPYSIMDNRSTGGDSFKHPQTPPTPISHLASPHSPVESSRGNFASLSEFGNEHQRGPSHSNISSFMQETRSATLADETPISEGASTSYVRHIEPTRPLSPRQKTQSPTPSSPQSSYSAPSRRMTVEQKEPEPVVSTRPGIGRRPSGARAAPTNRTHNVDERLSSPVTEEESDTSSLSQGILQRVTMSPHDETAEHLDALAALSYLDINSEQNTTAASPSAVNRQQEYNQPPPPPAPQIVEPPATSAPMGAEAGQFRSSFAPSKQASERKAKAQAQQAAHQAAVHKPGRAGKGTQKPKAPNQGWAESSDEEEEEEGDEDEDDSDDGEPRITAPQRNIGASPNGSTTEIAAPAPSHIRPPRTLPQIPGGRLGVESDEYSQRRPDQFSDTSRRPQYDDVPQIRSQAEAPLPGAARQNVWSQVLDPGRKPDPPAPENSKFVQLEDSAHMTKAFTPHGLLSAGLQDKQDRSAKRQEELARESGASLVNVPNKPGAPQSGLLGVITAHERDRKREGGMGAALTEREREKRLAEERQRKFDEAQRQQLEQMQQMYGGQFGYNPMMANPMMMGMNPMMPMMTGGPMSPMMTGQMGFGGYNPQHMFAAQQAAQAYQQAMMAFSMAGSQNGEAAGQQPMLNPMMTGGMSNFDPRMTMMGGMPGMPMMGAPMMNPMGMQMTGMSTFDPRFTPNHTPSPSGEAGPAGGGPFNPQLAASQGSFTHLPMGNGSPQTRTPDDTRPSSPKA